jgi:hypothetical protein
LYLAWIFSVSTGVDSVNERAKPPYIRLDAMHSSFFRRFLEFSLASNAQDVAFNSKIDTFQINTRQIRVTTSSSSVS